jgi:TPR repeat protein
MVTSRPHVDPPPPPVIPNVPDPPPTTPAADNGGEVTGVRATFEAQCAQGNAQSCLVAGSLYEHGSMGAMADGPKAHAFYERGCKLGGVAACSKAKEVH